MILDLSHGVQLDHVTHPSVNEDATNPDVAPKDSIWQNSAMSCHN
jgi:hypothetical protein